jgi:hypothetical protein
MNAPLDTMKAKLDECQRVLSLLLDRFDEDRPWLPREYREMANDCLRGSNYDPSYPTGDK